MIPMTSPVPLRETTVWGGYREAAAIPHRYGPTGGQLLQYDVTRTLFVWADHPCASIDGVQIGGVDAQGWDWLIANDSTGRAVTFVRFNQPVDEGAELFARGRGKLHPITGAPLLSAGDVCWDILTNLAGWAVDRARLAAFDRALPLELGGSIERRDSVQTVLRSIAESCGALFAIDTNELLHPFPPRVTGRARATVSLDAKVAVSAKCEIASLCNDLTVQFDIQGGTPQQAARLDAPASIKRYGSRAEVLQLPWIVRSRDALAIATRLLKFRARPQWDISASGLRGVLSIGDVVAVDHPLSPIAGSGVVQSRQTDLQRSSVTLTIPISGEPVVRVVSQSAIYEAQSYVSATVELIGTDRVFTLTEGRDMDYAPMEGAAVTLDKAGELFTRYTDSRGKVSFPAYLMPGPADYILGIVTLDGRAFEYPVTV